MTLHVGAEPYLYLFLILLNAGIGLYMGTVPCGHSTQLQLGGNTVSANTWDFTVVVLWWMVQSSIDRLVTTNVVASSFFLFVFFWLISELLGFHIKSKN